MKGTRTPASKRKESDSVPWVERVRKWSLVFPRDLIPRIQRAARRKGVTYSQFVVAAVEAALSEDNKR
jgi:ribosomal protein L20